MAEGGKTDMERIGLFSEQGYHTVGDKYPKLDPTFLPFNQAAYKNRQMLPGGSKTKVEGLQSGYFEPTFKRIMEKEAYNDPMKTRRQDRMASQKKNLGGAFVPASGDKKPSGVGSFYGTMTGPGKLEAFSAAIRPRSKKGEVKKNFYTNPGPKGTGYGYLNVTIGKYVENGVDPYDRAALIRQKQAKDAKDKIRGASFKTISAPQPTFDSNPYKTDKTFPAKTKPKTPPPVKPFKYPTPGLAPGGNKAGTFTPYPEHKADVYQPKKKKSVAVNSSGKRFQDTNTVGPRSRPTKSIMALNVTRGMNRNNYKTAQRVMSY